MNITGKNWIGETESGEGDRTFRAVDPASGGELTPDFYEASLNEVDGAMTMAQQAFQEYRSCSSSQRAEFLREIGDQIESLGEVLVERASEETGLDPARIRSERARTINQLLMFAELVQEGSWLEARIDTADPDRKPIPKPDIRRIQIPLGPVAVFAASNFPLAFSVAGGDTASALAAGCPVVVKAHPAHPGTSELVGRCIQEAGRRAGLPSGVFSLLHGISHQVGEGLVRHNSTRAVAFTGSLRAGRALFDMATARKEPIPVYAEMGSINPVFLLPSSLNGAAAKIAGQLSGSITLGNGQFCTNPGLILGLRSKSMDDFVDHLSRAVSAISPGVMLYSELCRSYKEKTETFRGQQDVRLVSHSTSSTGNLQIAEPQVFLTGAETFVMNDLLAQEVFGPSSLVVVCDDPSQLEQTAAQLEGQLTASLFADGSDLANYKRLVEILQDRVGRLIFNGVPTGVEVCPSMHHGGPYPATTDSHYTSVGTAAIARFVRPVCYQDFPQDLLPLELQDRNVRGIWRLVNNTYTRKDIQIQTKAEMES